MIIKQLAEKYDDYIIEQRRYFHQNPELSLEEVETSKALKEQLLGMGIEVTAFTDNYGLIGHIKGGKAGKTVMLRADIDALPMEECSGESFAATNGKMHSCGHDCHMAMLLGAAKILSDIKAELPGNVEILFQSAEETGRGAAYYVNKGILDGVDGIFGMHIWGALEAQKMSLESGGRMASCDGFKITVHGKTAHGSQPNQGHDAIVAASSIMMNLQTFASRINDPLNTFVLSVGSVKAGQRFNIICNEVELEGAVRTYDREFHKTIYEELSKIVQNTAKALGCTADIEYFSYSGAVINEHDDMNRIARNAAVKLYGEEALTHMPKLMGSEDFAYFMEKIPGFFGFIGCRNEAIGAIYPNHSDKFKVDESVLHKGAAMYAQFAKDFLEEKAGGDVK